MGILKATEGSLIVDGLDAFDDRVAAKRLLGFLPEADSPEVIQSAQLMFRAFSSWMQGPSPESFTLVQPHLLS
jgi:ABC-type multidrug transport system ATPase subunit